MFLRKYPSLFILKSKEKSAESIKSLEIEKEQLSLNLTSTKTLLEEKVCTTISVDSLKCRERDSKGRESKKKNFLYEGELFLTMRCLYEISDGIKKFL